MTPRRQRWTARAWLDLVDSEKYEENWEEASEYFKSAITKDKWEESLHAVRKPLCKMVSRELTSSQYTTSLPGAPDGEYVVIQSTRLFSIVNEGVMENMLIWNKRFTH